jgi:hypothetical protein
MSTPPDDKRAARIEKAVAIINPDPAKLDACREDVDLALNMIALEVATGSPHKNQANRDDAREFAAALRKAIVLAQGPNMPWTMFFGLREFLGRDDPVDADPAITRRRVIAIFKILVEHGDAWAKEPGKAFREEGRLAAREAGKLLHRYRSKRPIPTTKDGDWDQLAKLLYGDGSNPPKSLQHAIRELAREYKAREG